MMAQCYLNLCFQVVNLSVYEICIGHQLLFSELSIHVLCPLDNCNNVFLLNLLRAIAM